MKERRISILRKKDIIFLLLPFFSFVTFISKYYFKIYPTIDVFHPESDNLDFKEPTQHIKDQPELNDVELVARGLGKTSPMTPEQIQTKKQTISLSIVISYCKENLAWIPGYVGQGYNVTDITIISKCGKNLVGEKELASMGAEINIIILRNVGRCDHSYAYWIKHNRHTIDETENGNNVVLFTKDNPRQMEHFRSFEDAFLISSTTGFSCILRQIASSRGTPRSFVENFPPLTTLELHRKEFLDSFTKLGHVRTPVDLDIGFKSPYMNLGEWKSDLEIVYPDADLVPVCYGGMFMVQKKGLLKQPPHVWDKIEKSLSRGNNLEEGHFVERAWAGIVTPVIMDKYLEKVASFYNPNILQQLPAGNTQGMVFVAKSFVASFFNFTELWECEFYYLCEIDT